MPTTLPPEYLDENTPTDVIVTDVGRARILDPTLGVALGAPIPTPPGPVAHPLVTIGDSLTHGMTSGAVYRTDLSWPAQVARVLNISPFDVPGYGGPLNGLPLNIEAVARRLQAKYGEDLSPFEKFRALLTLHSLLDENEEYWENQATWQALPLKRFPNLGIYGWDIRDALDYDDSRALDVAKKHRDQFAAFAPENDTGVAAHSVLGGFGTAATQIRAAQALGAGGGIGTLIVELGANNALKSVVNKKTNGDGVVWSGAGYNQLDVKEKYTVWNPTHFELEYADLVREVKTIPTARVLLATVPHVTIAPIAHGVNPDNPGQKWKPGSRFFPFYTDPWIDDRQFQKSRDRYITHQQARAIDSAIDQYNDVIADAVKVARAQGRDWYLLDLCGLLDSLAYRRYDNDPLAAQKNNWQPYQLPAEISNLDTRFFRSNPGGRTEGGLFGLDGVHPTTVGYGILAAEVLRVLAVAGVSNSGIAFGPLLAADSLNSNPPALVDQILGIFSEYAPWAAKLIT